MGGRLFVGADTQGRRGTQTQRRRVRPTLVAVGCKNRPGLTTTTSPTRLLFSLLSELDLMSSKAKFCLATVYKSHSLEKSHAKLINFLAPKIYRSHAVERFSKIKQDTSAHNSWLDVGGQLNEMVSGERGAGAGAGRDD